MINNPSAQTGKNLPRLTDKLTPLGKMRAKLSALLKPPNTIVPQHLRGSREPSMMPRHARPSDA